MNALVSVKEHAHTELLTCCVGEQWIGFHVQQVREVVTNQERTQMPLSPEAVLGLINLRGRVMTELDVRKVVGLPERTVGESCHVVIIETRSGEDFGLTVDMVGEVMLLNPDNYEPTPRSLDSTWKQVSEGVLKLDGGVLVLVNVERFIALTIASTEKDLADQAVLH